jgi:hypothetical protein
VQRWSEKGGKGVGNKLVGSGHESRRVEETSAESQDSLRVVVRKTMLMVMTTTSTMIRSRILNHGTRWRWVAHFTPHPLYCRQRTPTPTEFETRWASGPVRTVSRKGAFLVPVTIPAPDRPARSKSTTPTSSDESARNTPNQLLGVRKWTRLYSRYVTTQTSGEYLQKVSLSERTMIYKTGQLAT